MVRVDTSNTKDDVKSRRHCETQGYFVSGLSQTHKFGNIGLIANCVFPYICSFLLYFLFLNFLEDMSPFCGPLIPLFWTSGDVFPGASGHAWEVFILLVTKMKY